MTTIPNAMRGEREAAADGIDKATLPSRCAAAGNTTQLMAICRITVTVTYRSPRMHHPVLLGMIIIGGSYNCVEKKRFNCKGTFPRDFRLLFILKKKR